MNKDVVGSFAWGVVFAPIPIAVAVGRSVIIVGMGVTVAYCFWVCAKAKAA